MDYTKIWKETRIALLIIRVKSRELQPAVPVGEVNPLCGQRRSLLAQQGSRNNHSTLPCMSLITIKQEVKNTYLDSNAVV